MAKKKHTTYGKMLRQMEQTQVKMEKEKERMAGVMATVLLNDQAAVKLGDYSSTDLRRIMSMLSSHVDECIKILETEKQAKQSQ